MKLESQLTEVAVDREPVMSGGLQAKLNTNLVLGIFSGDELVTSWRIGTDRKRTNGVMIGRGTLGNPWLFRRTVRYLTTGEMLPYPDPVERLSMALHHFDLDFSLKGAGLTVPQMRKHLAWYLKGLPGAAQKRAAINSARTPEEVRSLLNEFRDEFTGK